MTLLQDDLLDCIKAVPASDDVIAANEEVLIANKINSFWLPVYKLQSSRGQ